MCTVFQNEDFCFFYQYSTFSCRITSFTCLVELKELLLQFLSVGLVAMSPEPLHTVSAPAWSLKAHWHTLYGGKKKDESHYWTVISEQSFFYNKQVIKDYLICSSSPDRTLGGLRQAHPSESFQQRSNPEASSVTILRFNWHHTFTAFTSTLIFCNPWITNPCHHKCSSSPHAIRPCCNFQFFLQPI